MRFAALLEKKAAQIKETLAGEILGSWKSLIAVDTDQRRITVLQDREGRPLTRKVPRNETKYFANRSSIALVLYS
jgi:hypothetical protein